MGAVDRRKDSLHRRTAVQPPALYAAQGRRADHARAGRFAGIRHQQIVWAGAGRYPRIAGFRPRAFRSHASPSRSFFCFLPEHGTRRRNDRASGRNLPAPVRSSRIRASDARAGTYSHALPDVCGDCHGGGNHGDQPVCDPGVCQSVCGLQRRTAADDADTHRLLQFHGQVLAADPVYCW